MLLILEELSAIRPDWYNATFKGYWSLTSPEIRKFCIDNDIYAPSGVGFTRFGGKMISFLEVFLALIDMLDTMCDYQE